jgi:ribosomal protein L24E
MTIEGSLDADADWQKHCIVCGKSVLDGEGFCHIQVEGEMVAICCPLCFETYEKNPKHYLNLQKLRRLARKPKKDE